METGPKMKILKLKKHHKHKKLKIQKSLQIENSKDDIDLSNGLEASKVLFSLKNRTKLLRTKFDYKLNYITKSYIKNGIIDEYALTKEYACECDEKCDQDCDCISSHAQKYECNENCQCVSNYCDNRVVQLGISTLLKIEYISKEKGFGVITKEKIKKNEFICEYVGMLIDKKTALDKIQINLVKRKPNYVLQIRENYEKMTINTFIDAEESGNVSRFLNHSCKPNLYFDIVRIHHFIPQVAFYALRDIEEGEELTFSYCEANNEESFKVSYKSCLCGSEDCKKFLPS